MKIDNNILKEYKDNGLLYCSEHPTLPLIIWNYSQKVQYEGLWDDITLECRGLVTDQVGNIVSRGFSKFFNIEENKHVPTDTFEVFEKLDGQYIAVFWYNGEMVINSRGSFTSVYVDVARKLLDEKYPHFKTFAEKNLTYCFELIGFEQIVVSYPEPDVILTGIFQIGNEQCLPTVDEPNHYFGCKVVKKFIGLDWKNIKQLNWKNSEGFVVRFSNGNRCKIKFEDYIRLHRIMTNISEKKIWQALKDGKPLTEYLEDVPDEFFNEVREIEDELWDKYSDIELDSEMIANCLSKSGLTRKQIAQDILNRRPKTSSIIFAMLDGKDYSKMIWEQLEPPVNNF